MTTVIRVGRRIRHLIEAAAAVLFVGGVLRILPLPAASALGGFAARTFGPLLKVSAVARGNLRHAFPEKSPGEISRIVRGVWDNLGRTAAEMPRLERLADQSLVDQIDKISARERKRIAQAGEPVALKGDRHELVGLENLFRLDVAGEPAIFYGAHIGNWEVGPLFAFLIGYGMTSVIQPPHNPYLARLVLGRRAPYNDTIASSGWGAAAGAANVLRGGGRLGMIVDQKVIDAGLPVPFFGRPAITTQAPARLAVHFDCPLVGAHVIRTRGTRFRIIISPPIEPPVTGGRDEKIRTILEQINRQIESWVRQAPDQWLWLHRRWHVGPT